MIASLQKAENDLKTISVQELDNISVHSAPQKNYLKNSWTGMCVT